MSAGAVSEVPAPSVTRPLRAVVRRARGRAHGDDFGVVTAENADGGLRLSLFGRVDSGCVNLRDVVIAALQSEPPRVEVELSGLEVIDAEVASFLLACGRMARLMSIEYRLTRPNEAVAAALADSVRGTADAVA